MIKIKRFEIKKEKIKRIIISIIITLVVEVFLCNYPAFRTLFAKDKNIETDFNLENNKIIISDIDTRVTSVNINYENELTDKITYNLSFVAEETSDTIKLKPKVILKNSKQYISLDTHSKCKKIEIELETTSDFKIESVILNHTNFNINLFRMFIIFLISVFVIKVTDGSFYKKEYDKNNKFQTGVFLINLMVLFGFIVIYNIYQYNYDTLIIKPENISKEDSILMQTEAFMHGQIPLLEEASPEIKGMENPYDYTKRTNEGISYLYDVAYYNGNYYNYFGVAPILTCILPFRAITGMYLHTYLFNLIYIFGIFISLYFLYRKLIEKYVKKVSLFNFYLGFYAILFGANILTLLRGAKYDIVVSSGIFFLTLAINLCMSINNNSRFKYLKLILLGISTGLIVLSKPNLIVYYPILLYLFLINIKDIELKDKIKYSIFVCVPLGILAVFQMIFNYLRFDSILEFGAKYQLTSFNMIYCMQFTFGKLFAGMLEYIFRIPTINPLEFPFILINTNTSIVTVNEICYENRLIGLIAIPIILIYVFTNNIFKREQNNEFKNFIKICIVTSIISILINSIAGGICEVYAIDFKLILCVCAILMLLKMIEKSKDEKMANKVFLILCITTILIMIPISFTTEVNFLTDLRRPITVFLKNVFEFWK